MGNGISLNSKSWDYTQHAKHYDKRPNYSVEAINHLCQFVKARKSPDYVVADVGAGTGALTVLLQPLVGTIFSIEPNAAMREIGIQKTKDFKNVKWSVGTGEQTNLQDNSVDWITFGSSFNTTDRNLTLKEAHRVLKPGGFFTCMWNNRDLEEPTQKKVEEIIKRFVPNYSHGTRREQQADVIIGSNLFNHLYYFEMPQIVKVKIEDYIEAWKSVKNAYWDLDTDEGKKLFEKIVSAIMDEFRETPILNLTYVTKVWTATRID
jgi:ubiquinone/menaquinone biosynthesis C-methylase UbiE